ncbi:hypothetical protein ACIQF6_25830 [Kitasatospora sp. NPDC092948]|uniref:hypothetical protein n=1 Tax=Kitasatospora sp. NPDC092948 TaxID=3364088 RepID=UPI0037FF2E30
MSDRSWASAREWVRVRVRVWARVWAFTETRSFDTGGRAGVVEAGRSAVIVLPVREQQVAVLLLRLAPHLERAVGAVLTRLGVDVLGEPAVLCPGRPENPASVPDRGSGAA